MLLKYATMLRFKQDPNYTLMTRLLEYGAEQLGFNLKDRLFDWAIKAVIITNYPELYSYILLEQTSSEYQRHLKMERKQAGF